MKSHTPVHVLFLGCGMATEIHSRVLRRLPNVSCSYASREATRASTQCARFGGQRSFGSYEAGLGDSGAQVAIVATPTATHLELALRALEAGLHVIVEKPAFLSVAEAGRARDAARTANRHVFVAENYVYKPLTRNIRSTIESGGLGDVRFVSLNATKLQQATDWRANPALSGGGALFESGVHWISFAARLGLDIADVQGLRAGAMPGADRSALVLFRFTNGAVGTLAHSWELRAPFGGARVSKIQGTQGAMTFESNGFASLTTGRRPGARVYLRDTLGYRAMHTDFLRALRHDEQPTYSFDMAIRDLHWLEAANASLQTAIG